MSTLIAFVNANKLVTITPIGTSQRAQSEPTLIVTLFSLKLTRARFCRDTCILSLTALGMLLASNSICCWSLAGSFAMLNPDVGISAMHGTPVPYTNKLLFIDRCASRRNPCSLFTIQIASYHVLYLPVRLVHTGHEGEGALHRGENSQSACLKACRLRW